MGKIVIKKTQPYSIKTIDLNKIPDTRIVEWKIYSGISYKPTLAENEKKKYENKFGIISFTSEEDDVRIGSNRRHKLPESVRKNMTADSSRKGAEGKEEPDSDKKDESKAEPQKNEKSTPSEMENEGRKKQGKPGFFSRFFSFFKSDDKEEPERNEGASGTEEGDLEPEEKNKAEKRDSSERAERVERTERKPPHMLKDEMKVALDKEKETIIEDDKKGKALDKEGEKEQPTEKKRKDDGGERHSKEEKKDKAAEKTAGAKKKEKGE